MIKILGARTPTPTLEHQHQRSNTGTFREAPSYVGRKEDFVTTLNESGERFVKLGEDVRVILPLYIARLVSHTHQHTGFTSCKCYCIGRVQLDGSGGGIVLDEYGKYGCILYSSYVGWIVRVMCVLSRICVDRTPHHSQQVLLLCVRIRFHVS